MLFHRFARAFALTAASLAFQGLAQPALHAAPQGAGHCLAFDGFDDFVGVPRSISLEPGELTVEVWAWLDGQQDWNTRILRKGLDDAYFLTCDQDLDRRMQFMFNRQHSLVLQAKDTQQHTAYLGTWHHFVGVYGTDRAEFWVDGVQKSVVNHSLGALTHLPLTDLCIGAGLPVQLQNEYFRGRIDEVRLWNYPRSATEIQASWFLRVPDDSPGLVAAWHFDEGTGNVAGDSSTSANHGQLGVTSGSDPSDPTWMVSDVPLGPYTCGAARYCASLPNSSGQAARIDTTGSLSISAADTHLLVSGAPAGKVGLFLYGSTAVQYPFGDGYLCLSPISGAFFRIPSPQILDAGGACDMPLDFNALPAAGPIHWGSTWNFQFWFRDPAAGGSGFNLSDALTLNFCP
jgi:hypothetical protein